MAWEWVAPTVTGGVGLAGMAATSFVAFAQQRNQVRVLLLERSHHEKDTIRTEKKEAYLKFMTAISEALNSVAINQGQAPLDTSKFILESQCKLISSIDELEILVPTWVSSYAYAATSHTIRWMKLKHANGKESIDVDITDPMTARAEFIVVMRAHMEGRDEDEARKMARDLRESLKEIRLGYNKVIEVTATPLKPTGQTVPKPSDCHPPATGSL